MKTEALERYLWPQGESLAGPQVYLLADGARDPELAALIRFGKLEYCCLFNGRLTPRLQAAAPYLVHLSAGSPLTRELLARTWGNSGGILTVVRADVTLEQQRRHFKKFLRVQDEDGRILQFRFYDPRVLRIYLPTCTAEELQRFFGPVSRIVMEPAEGVAPLDYTVAHGALASPRVAVADASDMDDVQLPQIVAMAVPAVPSAQGRGPEALDIAPLGLHHVEAYRSLQNDEDIRRWTGLPLHATMDDARRWIRLQLATAEGRLCVIRHPDQGIVGAMALEQRGQSALGYCWIGKPYRGRGYGRRAFELLRRFAAQKGLQRLYAGGGNMHPGALELLARAGATAVGRAPRAGYCLELQGKATPEQLDGEWSGLMQAPRPTAEIRY
jgi:RimJ/RimL family protein N-acetyltransferase